MEKRSYLIRNLDDLEKVAQKITAELPIKDTATVMALSGDLGAGKTTFVQQLGKCLGVEEKITSPTFTIMKGYELTKNTDVFERLIHVDAYRIDDLEELKPLRFAELLQLPKTLICIEWAQKIEVVLPEDRLNINIVQINDEDRNLTIF